MDEMHLDVAVALRLSVLASEVANFCDHTEHNEVADRSWVLDAGNAMRNMAFEYAESTAVDIIELYAQRLSAVEERNVLYVRSSFCAAESARNAKSWRALQLIQIEHDRVYHPDVLGLPKNEQLRHYALHLSKLAGAFSRFALDEVFRPEVVRRRLPDMLLFGLKLATVMGEKLPEDPLWSGKDERDSGLAIRGEAKIAASGL